MSEHLVLVATQGLEPGIQVLRGLDVADGSALLLLETIVRGALHEVVGHCLSAGSHHQKRIGQTRHFKISRTLRGRTW